MSDGSKGNLDSMFWRWPSLICCFEIVKRATYLFENPDSFNSSLFEPTYSNIEKESKKLCLDQSEDEYDFANIEWRSFLTELRFLPDLRFYVFQINSTLYLMPIPNKCPSSKLKKYINVQGV